MDIEQPGVLLDYLRATGRLAVAERATVTRLSGGVSSRTVLVEREAGEPWVMKQALEKLRVPVDWFGDPKRVHREALGMRWLSELAPAGSIPTFHFEDHDHHLVGMAAVPQPHHNWKSLLMQGRLAADHVEQFGQLIGTIHRNGYDRRERLAVEFDDRSFFESLRVEPYYQYTAARLPPAAGFLRALMSDMATRRLTVVHGDYSPKNILVRDGRLVLVDHEVIHFGDPAFDLGFSLTHLLSKANHLQRLREDFALAAQAYWLRYRATLGDLPWADELETHVVRHTLACLLARVAGRSTLEYLDESARARQVGAALSLLADPPGRVSDLIARFTERLASSA